MFRDPYGRPQSMFKTLRTLHVHNVDTGLNDLTEAFGSFMTRAKYFSTSLRRTWSHSAVEFMRYRRRLPSLMGTEGEGTPEQNDVNRKHFGVGEGKSEDEDEMGPETGDSRKIDPRKVFISNISFRVTTKQLASFFSKFGKVVGCTMPAERRSLRRRSRGIAYLTYSTAEEAEKAKSAPPFELHYYERTMLVTQAFPVRKRHSEQWGSSGIDLADRQRSETPEEPITPSPMSSAFTTSEFPAADTLNITDLGEAILIRVFQLLSIKERILVERVCKRFLEAAVLSWSKTKQLGFDHMFSLFRAKPCLLQNSTLKSILRHCGRYVEDLDVSAAPHYLDDLSLQLIHQHCPLLTKVNLTGLRMRWQGMKGFAENCHHLESLTLRNSYTLNQKGFWYLFRYCTKLKYLDLSGCNRFNGKSLRLLGNSVEEIHLKGCRRISLIGIEEMCGSCVNLRVLDLSGCQLLDDAALRQICKLNHLQVLSLDGLNPNCTAAGYFNIGAVESLKELSLKDCPHVTDALLATLSRGCTSLEKLNLSGAGHSVNDSLTELGFVQLATGCPRLNDIDFSFISTVSDNVLMSYCGSGALRTVKVVGCVQLTDKSTAGLSCSCPHLWELDISGCFKITDKTVEAFLLADRKVSPNCVVTLVVGGTFVQWKSLEKLANRVILDFADHSNLNADLPGPTGLVEDYDDVADEDDEFDELSFDRSYMLDAVGESPETEEQPDNWDAEQSELKDSALD